MDLYTIRNQLNMGISLSNISLRVTDYARVSTDHMEQKKSLQNQMEHFEEYIKQNSNWTYVDGYVDDGITGTSDVKREKFMQMIEDARKGKFDLIVTKEISRFSRNTLDSIKYTRELLSYGVAVLFVNDNINTALPDAELRLTIMASMAQDEIRRLSERVKFGMHRAIERGEILGNDHLYGYQKENGILKIIPKEAEQVRQIYAWYAIDQYSLSKIVRRLNEQKISTGNQKKWCTSTISRMIENPKYKGFYCGKKSEIIDYMTKKVQYFEKEDWIQYEDREKIPKIVENDLWERANERLSIRKKSFQKQNHEKIEYHTYPYSGKLYCKEHNTVFHRRKFRKANDDITWVCATYLKEGKKSCDTPNIRESELQVIMEDIIEFLKIDVNKAINILIEQYHMHGKSSNQIEENYQKEIEKINQKKDKLLNLRLEDSISNEEFISKKEQLNQKLEELKIMEKESSMEEKFSFPSLEIYLKERILQKDIQDKIISSLLHRIVVSKIDNNKQKIYLKVYLSYEVNQIESIYHKIYTFERGYDTKGTKRYQVYYQVDLYGRYK